MFLYYSISKFFIRFDHSECVASDTATSCVPASFVCTVKTLKSSNRVACMELFDFITAVTKL
jgi:hypothetical protein